MGEMAMFQRWSSLIKHVQNAVSGSVHVLVLPDTKHGPPRISEPLIRLAIPPDVASELRAPVPRVGYRRRAVVWAAVPEASVYEYGKLYLRENDVNSDRSSTVDFDVLILTEASTRSMKR